MRKNVRAQKNSQSQQPLLGIGPRMSLARTAATVVESIEHRVLLSGALFSGNTLTVTGSSASDSIDVNYTTGGAGPFQITTTINGVKQSFVNEPLQKVVINSGDGNDIVSVEEADGYSSNDVAIAVSITAGAGNDNIATNIANTNAAATLSITTGNGNDSVMAIYNGMATITGGSGADTYNVQASYAELPAYATVYGGNGNDLITAGAGGNAFVTAYGQGGDDTFQLQDIDDTLAAYGGTGANTYYRNYYTGSEDNTVIALDGQWHNNLLLGTDIHNITGYFDGNVSFYANGTTNDDIQIADAEGVVSLVGGGGNDTLSADYGNSSEGGGAGATAYLEGGSGMSLLIPGTGVNHFSNGTGIATADFANSTADIQIYLDGSQDSGDPTAAAYDYVNNVVRNGAFDTFDGNVQNVIGGSGNNLIEGTGANNILTGGSGNDTLVSNGGADALFGGDGNDTFEARDASSTDIDGGAGANTAYTDPADVTYNVQNRNPDLAVPTQFTGVAFGTPGSYQNQGNTIAKVFDGNVNTYFDAPSASLNFVALDLGSSQVVNQMSFAPRAGWESRMVGGMIQGSNTASFGAAVTLYTVNLTPVSGALTTVGFHNTTAYRYYRYIGPANSYSNIAELQLFNSTQPFIAEDSTKTLDINGTSQSDTIAVTFETDESLNFDRGPDFNFVDETFTVAINGISEAFTNNTITQIIINSGEGNDTINVSGFEQYDGARGGNVLPFPYINFQVFSGDGNNSISTNIGHDQSYSYQSDDYVQVTVGDGNNMVDLQGGYSQSVIAGNGNNIIGCGATYGASDAGIEVGNGNNTISAGSAGDGGEGIEVNAGTGQDTIFTSDYEDDASFFGNDGVHFDIPYGTAGMDADLSGNVNYPNAQVYLDNNNDGAYDTGDALVTADRFGNYVFSNLTPAQPDSTYNIRVIPPAGYEVSSPSSGLFTITTGAGYGYSGIDFTLKTTSLPGAVIGTTGSYKNQGNTAANAFDGNLTTYYDAATPSGSWIGLNLGSPQVITQINFAPRAGWETRMVGGVFQGSNSPTFSQGVVTLYTVTATPATGVFTTAAVSRPDLFQYVRYLGPANSYCNIGEIDFFGHAPPAPAPFVGTAIGTAGSYNNQGNTLSNALDGNLATFFDAPIASGAWMGVDLGSAQLVDQVQFAPRSGWTSRMVGGEIQASNSADFTTGVVTLYTMTATPTAGVLTTASFSNTTAYRYYRYIGANNSYCNIAELEFPGV